MPEKDLSISLEDLLITLQTYTKKIDKELGYLVPFNLANSSLAQALNKTEISLN